MVNTATLRNGVIGMGELIILDNTDAEVATLADIDVFRALPIVAVGPNREAYLKAFVDSAPFDITLLDDDAIRTAFISFLERIGDTGGDSTQANIVDQVEPSGGNEGDAESALAEREAMDTTDTPPEQPADTDTEAGASTQTVAVKCWNCNGEKYIAVDDKGDKVPCNLCRGTGQVQQEVAA